MFTVMIVDDMDFVRRDIKRLKLWGEKSGFYILEEAKNGSEALMKLDLNPVDLIITDIKMPKIDGIELLRKIMEKNICPCVVFLSDYSNFDYVRQGLVLGAFDYLKKPANEEELEKLLHRAKEFILGIRKEQDRVRKLEEKLDEKVEAYLPKHEVNQIIEMIQDGDSRICEAASHIADISYANLNYDLIKTEGVLSTIIHEIAAQLSLKFKWLDSFVNINELSNTDFSNCSTIESLKTVFIQCINRIQFIINTLLCGKSRKGIVDQICNHVLENVDMEVSLSSVAEKLFMNKTYMSELFKQKSGITFVEYLKVVKMERAKKLLFEEELKIFEIAEKLGYRDIEYFSKLFKRHTGFTPTEFRKINARNDK